MDEVRCGLTNLMVSESPGQGLRGKALSQDCGEKVSGQAEEESLQAECDSQGWLIETGAGVDEGFSFPPLLPFKPSQQSQHQTPLIQLSLIKLLIGLGISMGPGQASRLLSCSWVTPPVVPPLLPQIHPT